MWRFIHRHLPKYLWLFLLVSTATTFADSQGQSPQRPDISQPSISSLWGYVPTRVTQAGSIVQLGHRIFFFEGMGRKELNRIYNAFLYGGVVPALLQNITEYTLLGSYMFFPAAAKILEPAYSLMAKTGFIWNLFNIGESATYSVMTGNFGGALLHIRELNTSIDNLIPSSSIYLLALSIMGLQETLRDNLSILTSSKSINATLSSASAQQVMIRAMLPNNGSVPYYEIHRIALAEPGTGDLHTLSQLMGALGAEKLTIQPDLEAGDNLLVNFTDGHKKRSINMAIKGNFGTAPWLIRQLHEKNTDPELIQDSQSILSTAVIQAILEGLMTYSACEVQNIQNDDTSAEHCDSMERIAQDYFVYRSTEQEPSPENLLAIELSPTRDALYLAEKGSDTAFQQYWVPKAIGQFVATDLAISGRIWGGQITHTAFQKTKEFSMKWLNQKERVLAAESKARKTDSSPSGTTESHEQPDKLDPHKSHHYYEANAILGRHSVAHRVQLRQKFDRYKPAPKDVCPTCSEYKGIMAATPCGQSICPECLLQMGRVKAGQLRHHLMREAYHTSAPQDFSFPCPFCRKNIKARVLEWDAPLTGSGVDGASSPTDTTRLFKSCGLKPRE